MHYPLRDGGANLKLVVAFYTHDISDLGPKVAYGHARSENVVGDGVVSLMTEL